MYKIFKLFACIFCLAFIAAISACQAPFNERVINAQNEIAASFSKIGYGPMDAVTSRSVPQQMQGKKWFERQVSFADRCDKEWDQLHKFFLRDAKYDFDYDLRVGESSTDLESIRWFEFKLDHYYTICRVAFVRKGRHELIPRNKRKKELKDNIIRVDGHL